MEEEAQFGNYELLEGIARGGMGEVWRARHRMLKREAAIKVIRGDMLATGTQEGDSQLLRRFEREAQATSALKSPHTVEIYDFGTTESGTFYYAMELLDGLSLKALVERYGPLPPERVVYILEQVCESLAEAHENGLIHRDIKPANINVCRYGLKRDFVKVLDFGLVKGAAGQDEDGTLTASTAIAGSPAFMPPEVAQPGSPRDARSDIYALGCVAYWLLTGTLVFEAESPLQMIMAHAQETPLPPSQRAEEPIPEALDEVVLACLAKDPAARPQTAEELRQRLEACTFEHPWTEARAVEWWKLHVPSAALTSSDPTMRRRRLAAWVREKPARRSTLLVVLVLLVLGGLSAVVWWRAGRPGASLLVEPQGADASEIRSIAVLPLANLTGDPAQDHFVDGMHEALIAELAQVEDLTVISRRSMLRYRDSEQSIEEVAKELHVDAVVEGSVSLDGDQVRITAQLIAVDPERHLWTDVYDGEMKDVLTLQSQVATAVAEEIRGALTPDEEARLAVPETVEPEVYMLVLQGKRLCNTLVESDHLRGIAHLTEALARAPDFAAAHAGLAGCYSRLAQLGFLSPAEAFPPARAEATRALELDDKLGEAYATRGVVKLLADWDARGAERDFDRALKLEPNNLAVLMDYGFYLTTVRRFDDARRAYDRAVELDPFSPTTALWQARASFLARDYDASIQQLEQILELDPDFTYAHLWLAMNHAEKGDKAGALAECARVEALEPASEDQNLLGLLGWVYGVTGQEDRAAATLERMKGPSPDRWVDPLFLAWIHIGMGDEEDAFRWLGEAYQQHSSALVLMDVHPLADDLRSDPRFSKLLKDIGLKR